MSVADDAAFALAYRMAGEALEAAMRELEFVGPPSPFDSPLTFVVAGRVNMGRPRFLLPRRPGHRGRPPKRSQYDRAMDVRRLSIAYVNRKKQAANLGKLASLLKLPGVMDVVEAVLSDRSIPPRRRVAEIVSRYAEARPGRVLEETSLRRALKKAGLI